MTVPGRVIGLDLGTRRVGVAVSDDRRTIATPFETIKRCGDQPVEHGRVADIVAETGANLVVVGLPRSLDGHEGNAVRLVRSEIRNLSKRLDVDVVEHDERFTTVTAEHSLRAAGTKRHQRRDVVDQVAAAVVLQGYLDALSSRG